MAMLSVRVAFPVFVSVTLCAAPLVPIGWVPDWILVADSLTTPAVASPVPVSDTLCGLPEALSVMVTAALFFFNDAATTEIFTLSLHDALPISPQVLV